MTANKTITVLLIDDHPVVRSGYRRLLENTTDIKVVAEADNGELGCVLYQKYKPDIAIIDLNMPGIGGLETIYRIKKKNPHAKILVFSMHTNEPIVKRVLQMGVSGYITKEESAEQLLKAVRQVSQGRMYIDPEINSIALTELSMNSSNEPLDVLSKREFQLFQLLAEGNSIAQIAEILSISPKTVGVHHANIMKKLKLQNNLQLIRLAIRCNIICP
ncbi:response regulator [Nitrosomonas aestuarii]|uniref:response regulator n=1 Tax=Nitrosomonas aestuarii TaxID=52441 RepID=UPI000D2F81C0|nr:response regulator transcription factor [Nitrosomonas aestuarii]PTN13323.1 LuxR family two component transcriptional regulator [Nitrosomonas aestuarii]